MNVFLELHITFHRYTYFLCLLESVNVSSPGPVTEMATTEMSFQFPTSERILVSVEYVIGYPFVLVIRFRHLWTKKDEITKHSLLLIWALPSLAQMSSSGISRRRLKSVPETYAGKVKDQPEVLGWSVMKAIDGWAWARMHKRAQKKLLIPTQRHEKCGVKDGAKPMSYFKPIWKCWTHLERENREEPRTCDHLQSLYMERNMRTNKR